MLRIPRNVLFTRRVSIPCFRSIKGSAISWSHKGGSRLFLSQPAPGPLCRDGRGRLLVLPRIPRRDAARRLFAFSRTIPPEIIPVAHRIHAGGQSGAQGTRNKEKWHCSRASGSGRLEATEFYRDHRIRFGFSRVTRFRRFVCNLGIITEREFILYDKFTIFW